MSTLRARRERIAEHLQRAAVSLEEQLHGAAERGLRTGLEATLAALATSPAFYRLVDEVVQYLVHHPDVEALIHEQTASIAVDAVDDLRARAARADTAFDRIIIAVRRRLMAK